MTSTMIKRCTLATSLLLCAALALTGCYHVRYGAAYGAVKATNRAGWRQAPSVKFENYSDVDIIVRYWTATRDTTVPGGLKDWRTEHWARLAPGECEVSYVGRRYHLTANTDMVVRARLAFRHPETDEKIIRWFEFEPSPPYKFEAWPDEEILVEFRDSREGRALLPVPPEERFEGHRDGYPVLESADATPGEPIGG